MLISRFLNFRQAKLNMKKDSFDPLPFEIVTEIAGLAPKNCFPLNKRFRAAVDQSKTNNRLGCIIRQSVENHACYLSKKPIGLQMFQYDEFLLNNQQRFISKRAAIYPVKSDNANGFLLYEILNFPNLEEAQTAKITIYPKSAYLTLDEKTYSLRSKEDLEKIFNLLPPSSHAASIWIWLRGLLLNKNLPLTDKFFLGAIECTLFLFELPLEAMSRMTGKNTLTKIASIPLFLVAIPLAWILAFAAFVAVTGTPLFALAELTAKVLISAIVFPVIAFTWIVGKVIDAMSSICCNLNYCAKGANEPRLEATQQQTSIHRNSFFWTNNENKHLPNSVHEAERLIYPPGQIIFNIP